MSTKNSRSGGKYGGSHTTVTPDAGIICDAIHNIEGITKISPGYIKSGLRSVGGKRRVKILIDTGFLLVTVRGNTTTQEIYIYSNDLEIARNKVGGEIKKLGFILKK